MTRPKFPVCETRTVIPINGINDVSSFSDDNDFIIIGAGKTGMDGICHLLKNGVDKSRIRWIMPSDSYIYDRNGLFGTEEEVIKGSCYPFDIKVKATKNKAATLSRKEYAMVKTVTIIRKGRVSEIQHDTMVLKEGEEPITDKTILVDCSANGLTKRPVIPLFYEDRIILQPT